MYRCVQGMKMFDFAKQVNTIKNCAVIRKQLANSYYWNINEIYLYSSARFPICIRLEAKVNSNTSQRLWSVQVIRVGWGSYSEGWPFPPGWVSSDVLGISSLGGTPSASAACCLVRRSLNSCSRSNSCSFAASCTSRVLNTHWLHGVSALWESTSVLAAISNSLPNGVLKALNTQNSVKLRPRAHLRWTNWKTQLYFYGYVRPSTLIRH